MKQDMIVILDLGSTENTVIARRIRDMGVYRDVYKRQGLCSDRTYKDISR